METVSVWFAIDLPYAYFYVEARDGIIVKTAPIGAWMMGKTVSDIEQWVKRKGGSIKTD